MADGADRQTGLLMGGPTTSLPDQMLKKGLIANLTARVLKVLIGKDISTYPQPLTRSSELGAGDAAYQSFQNTYWKVAWDRRTVYNDLREMDLNDPLISTALDIIADCATGYEQTDVDAFEWMLVQANPEARQILDELKIRCELGHECWQMVRQFVCFGEEFREMVVDEQGIVRRFKHLPSYQVAPILDVYGNRAGGWEQRLDGAMSNMGKPIQFQEWEIIPFIYGAHRGWQGTGLMMPARRTWKRLVKMEDGMALARLIRAYDKMVHHVPVKPEWDEDRQLRTIQNYVKNMSKRKGIDENGLLFSRENPFQVETNIYLPEDGTGRAAVEIMKSDNAQLQNIDDVLYHQALLLTRLKVPSKYLNLVRKSGALTDSGLSAEDRQFARTLRQVQAVLRMGLLRLAHYALAFQGFDSDALGVGVNLAKISTDDQLQDAKISLTLAQAADLFSQIMGGLPHELLMDKFMMLSDDEKELVRTMIKKHDLEEVPDEGKTSYGGPQSSTRRGATGRFRNPKNGDGGGDDDAGSDGDAGVNDQAVDAREVSRVLAKLGTLAQAEMEKRGIPFSVGYDERLELCQQAISDRLALR